MPSSLLLAALLAPTAPTFDSAAYYRLTTEWQGECKSLDVVNDDTDDQLALAPSADVSGQYWKITSLGGGYFRLTSWFTGTDKSLDVINDGTNDQVHLAATGNYSGQSWKIVADGDGYYRLTSEFTGPGESLDIVNDSTDDKPRLAPTGVVSGQRWHITKESFVTKPPATLGLSSFYKKYLDADGLPIVSSNEVPDAALFRVRFILRQMLSRIPAVRTKLAQQKVRVAIMAEPPTEVTTTIPEYKVFAGTTLADGRPVDTVRGFGATTAIPVALCAEENVECYTLDVFHTEDILVHEFGHTVHLMGLAPVFGKPFKDELLAAWNDAKRPTTWGNTYANTNIDEYFAEGLQDWFNINAQAVPGDGIHNSINTRAELKTADPKLHALLAKYFPEDQNNCSCHKPNKQPTVKLSPKMRKLLPVLVK